MTSGPHDDHYPVNPPLGGFLTGKGLWTPSGDDALWQIIQGGAYWSGVIGTLGVQFRVLVASAIGTGGTDFLYDDAAALYDTARYSTGDISFFDITPLVRDFRIGRGRQHLGGTFDAGQAGLTLSNDSGVFNPQRGQALIGDQVLRPGRTVGFQGKRTDDDIWETLWLGRIDSLGDVYLDAAHDVISNWACTDFFTLMNNDAPPKLEVVDPATAGQLTSERIEYIWGLTGYDTQFLDVADVGVNTMKVTDFPGSRLEQIQSAEAAEGGVFFQSRDGKLTFHNQTWLEDKADTIDHFIGQDASELKVLDVKTSWDAVRIINQAGFIREPNGDTPVNQVVNNTTSQAQYGVRSRNASGLQNDNDTDVFGLANRAVDFNSFDSLRIDEVSVWARTLDVVNELLTIEIGDVVQVQVKTALGWDYTIVAWVFGVEHTVTHTNWETVLRLDNTFRGNPALAGAYSTAYSDAYSNIE